MPGKPRHICGHLMRSNQDCLEVRTLDDLKARPCPRCTMLHVEVPTGRLVRGTIGADGTFYSHNQPLEIDSRCQIVPGEGNKVVVTLPKDGYPWSIAIRVETASGPSFQVVWQPGQTAK